MYYIYRICLLLKLRRIYYKHKNALDIFNSIEVNKQNAKSAFIQKVRAKSSNLFSTIFITDLYAVPIGFIINNLIMKTGKSLFFCKKALGIFGIIVWSVETLTLLFYLEKFICAMNAKIRSDLDNENGAKRLGYLYCRKTSIYC